MTGMIPINPYIAGNPVGGSEAFIGRADVLREVVRGAVQVLTQGATTLIEAFAGGVGAGLAGGGWF